MDIERAKELTAGCVNTVTAVMFGGGYVPLPDAPLAELLEANAIVEKLPPEPIEGGHRIRTHCDPRIVALHYAFEQYGQSPSQMLEALGYQFRERQ